jgi:hypothetical protein
MAMTDEERIRAASVEVVQIERERVACTCEGRVLVVPTDGDREYRIQLEHTPTCRSRWRKSRRWN